ncbi:MAG TPA: hypothetical protein VHC69_00840 [Polyangiaceae bacterium]|nr:hypothetical protein [Polyangiaceae bacterium]
MARLRLLAIAVLLVACVARSATAAGQVTTCIAVEAAPEDRDALARLVDSEVSRHPSHRVSHDGCETHLHVELLDVRGDRFLTGRLDGEIPQRVPVEGKSGRALESAVTELVRVVLGNDPVVLHAPGEQSFFSARVLELKNLGKNTFDVAAVEALSLLGGRATFEPGILVGFTREVSSWQLGVEALFAQRLNGHAGHLDLDTLGRLQVTGALYFSKEADTSFFAGMSLGLGYQRFTGPRGAGLPRGDGEYSVAGPGLAIRGGIEAFRSTTTRVTLFAEAFVPMFVASDDQTEIVQSYVPTLTVCAGARF